MIELQLLNSDQLHDEENLRAIARFLYEHLGEYGDPLLHIRKAIDYALSQQKGRGGCVIISGNFNRISGAVVINETGMEEYIPENILVYIAVDTNMRGQGIGRKLIEYSIENTKGGIALHVEPGNPARKLYESLGFTNKYLEMRLTK